jgi:hypothetical protein
VLQNVRNKLDFYLAEYETEKGLSTDFYCDEKIIHPMAIAKYILTLCSLYRSGLINYNSLVNKTNLPIEQLISSNVGFSNNLYLWGLGFEYGGLDKNEPYLITTAIVAQSLIELSAIKEQDVSLKQMSDHTLKSIEFWVDNYQVYSPNMGIMIPKYSLNIDEPVLNHAAYAYALLIKYFPGFTTNKEGNAFFNALWKVRICGVGWKYSAHNPVVDLLHTCYIQNSIIQSQSQLSKELIHEFISMINQFNCCNNALHDSALIRENVDDWTGGVSRYINSSLYIEMKDKKVRLWSFGELLVTLSSLIRHDDNPFIEKFARQLVVNNINKDFQEKNYFRHTMHLTHGLAMFLEVVRRKRT